MSDLLRLTEAPSGQEGRRSTERNTDERKDFSEVLERRSSAARVSVPEAGAALGAREAQRFDEVGVLGSGTPKEQPSSGAASTERSSGEPAQRTEDAQAASRQGQTRTPYSAYNLFTKQLTREGPEARAATAPTKAANTPLPQAAAPPPANARVNPGTPKADVARAGLTSLMQSHLAKAGEAPLKVAVQTSEQGLVVRIITSRLATDDRQHITETVEAFARERGQRIDRIVIEAPEGSQHEEGSR